MEFEYLYLILGFFISALVYFCLPQVFAFFLLILIAGLFFFFTASFLGKFKMKSSTISDKREQKRGFDRPDYPSYAPAGYPKILPSIQAMLKDIDKNPFFKYKLRYTLKICALVLIPSALGVAFFMGFFSHISDPVENTKIQPDINDSYDCDFDGLPDASEVNIFHTDPLKMYSHGKIDDANRLLIYCPQYVNCHNSSRDEAFLSNISNGNITTITSKPFDWSKFSELNWSSCNFCSEDPGLYGIWQRDPIVQRYAANISFQNISVNQTIENVTYQINKTVFFVNDTPLSQNNRMSSYGTRGGYPAYYLTHGRQGTNVDSILTSYVLLKDAEYSASIMRGILNQSNITRPITWIEFRKNNTITENVLYSDELLNKTEFYSNNVIENITAVS